jgi:hypothetical protein
MNADQLSKIITLAENHRQEIGWDKQADEGNRIYDNKLPLKSKNPNDPHYVDNWILKSINWLNSMLTGADISVELQSIRGNFDQSMLLMQCELNFMMDIFKWIEQGEKALIDKYKNGIGCVKCGWNTRKRDNDFQSGIPVFKHVDSKKIYLDPNPNETKYIIHLEQLDKDQIVDYFPEYPELKRIQKRKYNLYIIQVKETKIKKQVAIYIEDKDQIIYHDYDEYLKEIENGLVLPEGVKVSNQIDTEYDQVTEYLYLKDEKRILQTTEIGNEFTYTILKANPVTDSPYSFGIPYYLKDMQELSILIMDILALSTLKHHKPIRIVYPEAIENYEEIKDIAHLPGVDIRIKPEWQALNPEKKPIEFINPPKFNNELEFLEQKISQVIKSTTGVTDTMQGQPEYSNISGVAVAQYQTAGKVVHKKDYIHWSRFITQNIQCLMNLLTKYRNYPHEIMGVDESNLSRLVEVATNPDNQLQNSNYIITIQIDENQDAINQMERELMLKLYSMGLVTEEDVLAKMPFKNVDKLIQNIQNRKEQQAQAISQGQQIQNPSADQINALKMKMGA